MLDVAGKEGRPSIVNASWVGDRLELRATVHLDLETMELRYALPQRAEHEALPSWNPDGRYEL